MIAPVPDGEVQHLAASARGTSGTGGHVDLQWVNSTVADEVRDPLEQGPDRAGRLRAAGATRRSWRAGRCPSTPRRRASRTTSPSPGLEFDTAYCYSVFVKNGTTWSPGRTVKARPFNADTSPVKWAYSTGATSVVPPVVGKYGILLMSNDQTVHALTRGGTTGGSWPTDWVPRRLAGVAHSRSPIVPFVGSVLVAAGETAPVRRGRLRRRAHLQRAHRPARLDDAAQPGQARHRRAGRALRAVRRGPRRRARGDAGRRRAPTRSTA